MLSVLSKPTAKIYYHGTHRSRPLEETLQLASSLFAASGITRVAVVTGLDTLGIPVVMVTRPTGRSLSVTQGKGLTLTAAKVSGVMEALEHYHAETIELPLRYASHSDFPRDSVIDVRGLVRAHSKASLDNPCLWISGLTLTDARPVWVPFECVHLDHRMPLPAGSGQFLSSSNGLASGNSLAEAINHGLFEVVERHQAACFYDLDVAQQASHRIALSSVRNPNCTDLLARIHAGNGRVAIWDLSAPLGVPAFLCDLIEREPDPFRPVPRGRGLGCHSDKNIALCRALTEAAQSRLTRIVGSRDDTAHAGVRQASTVETWQQSIRQHTEPSAEVDFNSVPSFDFDYYDVELAWLMKRIGARRTAVAVDLSKPGAPISVVRIIVPGLRLVNPIEATT